MRSVVADAGCLQELLSQYLFNHPDSIVASNLRACNLYQLTERHIAAVR